jgi:DNA-binding SARP family transcriptional activator
MWRKALDERRLETVGHGYRLNLGVDECDLFDAQRRLANGQTAARSQDWQAAVDALTDALHLWAPGFDQALAVLLPESEVRRLLELHLVTVEEWAHAVLLSGSPRHELIEVLRDTLALHPLRERVAELLMWTLSGNGDQQAALACYERVRRTLADELGQDPGEALRAMHVRVLRHDAQLRPPTERIGFG